MSRDEQLLVGVAEDFENMASPLSGDWLSANNVELDELEPLYARIALILKGWALAPDNVKDSVLVCAAAKDKKDAEYLTEIFRQNTAISKLGSAI